LIEEITMSIATNKRLQLAIACAVLGAANTVSANPVTGALGEWKPIIDLRLRYEAVDQEPLVEDAEAVTARLRLGVETGKAWSTALLVEGEFVAPIVDDYRADPAVAKKTAYPVVADPEAYELNRLQLTNTSIANTTMTLGRQRINLDDQRFIGAVGWRQNEQTFDALRVVNKPGGGKFTIDAAYLNRVNRIYGADSPQGVYKGDIFLGNAAYQFSFGKLSGFAYLLDFDPILPPTVAAALNPARMSTQTFGVRLAGDRPLSKFKIGYTVSYATQDKYGNNPLVTVANPDAVKNDYFLGELSATYKQYTLLIGDEILQGNGTAGFSTPLATLHKFQGWVDKFLTTPANGIDDRYASATATFKGIGPLDTLSAVAVYHTYESERMSLDYGDEVNLMLVGKWQRFTGTLKYGDYSQGNPAYRDTSKFWAQIDYVW
jgi:hypothetical protein